MIVNCVVLSTRREHNLSSVYLWLKTNCFLKAWNLHCNPVIVAYFIQNIQLPQLKQNPYSTAVLVFEAKEYT